MLELGGGAGFALEALDELFIEGQGEGQDLDRDVALELPLARLEHDRHPAAPQLLEDLVLVLELRLDEIEFRDLLPLTLQGRSREIQPAGAAEPVAVVVPSAAAGTVHSSTSTLRGSTLT